MHILNIIDTLNVGGAERAAIDLANFSQQSGLRVSFCTTRDPGKMVDDLSPFIDTLHLNRTRRFECQAIQKLRHFINDNQIDLIHAHMRSTASFVALLKVLKLLNIPVLFQDHYGGIEIDQTIPRWLVWGGAYNIEHYVGVYPPLCAWAEKAGFTPNKISLITYGVNLNRLNTDQKIDVYETFNLPHNRPVGIVVGNLRQEKGTDLLINLIASSPTAREAIYLLVGRGADPAFSQMCRDLVKQQNLEDTVYFVGLRQDVPILLNSVDFALMPSRSESGPLVLIEYLAAGLPFVAFNVGNLSNQMADLNLPGFASPGDLNELGVQLETLLSLSAEQRRRRGQMGRSFAQENFSIEGRFPQWLDLYQQLIAEKTR